MAVELAPRNKAGLSLRSPLMAGSGAVGYADSWPPGVAPEMFGAVVTGPVTLRARRGPAPPRLAELPAGFALATGDHNPGYHRILRDHDPMWRRLDVSVIVALGSSRPEDWARLAEHLEEESGAAGLELALPADVNRGDAAGWVAGVRRACTLPVLVKLPVGQTEALAGACVEAGADALVIGGASPVVARTVGPVGQGPEAAWIEGMLGGPAALPFTLRALRAVVALELDAPLIAAGGVTRLEDARHCLGEGAVAVQVRSLLWTDPAATVALAHALAPPREP
jgi:dihydroorotate dehydrogenase (NAD+) catalytic subunit